MSEQTAVAEEESATQTPPPEGKKARPGPSRPWEITETGVKIGACEFTLKAGPAVVFRYGEEAAVATQTYAILTSAEAALSEGRGEFDHLLERTRATARARGHAEQEIQRLTNVFCRFFEPAGIDMIMKGAGGRLAELAADLIDDLSRRGE